MEGAGESFVGKLSPQSEALFHYSGHGLQIEQENYLVPVDFQLKDAASVKYDAVSASKLHDRMAATGSKLNIVILDACRTNGFSSSRSSGSGLAAMNAARGSFIAFSTAPGRIAADNPEGRNGLFTGYLLEALRVPGLPLDEVFNRVRENTYSASNGIQVPWSSSSVIGRFYFSPSDGRDLQLVSGEDAAAQTTLTGAQAGGGVRQTTTTAPRPPVAAAVTAAELDERLTLLASRAAGVSQSLEQLKASQAQSGLGLRRDMVGAEQRMGFNLRQSEERLGAGDRAGASRSMDLAEKAIEQLERFLGR